MPIGMSQDATNLDNCDLWELLEVTMIEHFLPICVKGDKRFMRKFDSTVKYYFRGDLPGNTRRTYQKMQ